MASRNSRYSSCDRPFLRPKKVVARSYFQRLHNVRVSAHARQARSEVGGLANSGEELHRKPSALQGVQSNQHAFVRSLSLLTATPLTSRCNSSSGRLSRRDSASKSKNRHKDSCKPSHSSFGSAYDACRKAGALYSATHAL